MGQLCMDCQKWYVCSLIHTIGSLCHHGMLMYCIINNPSNVRGRFYAVNVNVLSLLSCTLLYEAFYPELQNGTEWQLHQITLLHWLFMISALKLSQQTNLGLINFTSFQK